NGVEAAIMMQKGVVAHNTANPNLPLHLKIGINAGEPISEDNDLFGTTVQMAARIVDKAQADQIFVSEIVRGICAGKPIRFANRGAYEMKGFDGGVVLYEVLWLEGQQAAETPAAAAQS
ncbi:MAG: adenylate/guanylate cyclase domain-containing protein, partial [Rhodospirillales bacterium]